MTTIQEYFSIHQEYEKTYGKQVVVFYQVGQFFEIYSLPDPQTKTTKGCDIEELAFITDLRLTSKNSKEPISEKNPRLVGIPLISQEKYTDILLQHGYTVVVVEQSSSGSANPRQTIERSVTQVIMPGLALYKNDAKHHFILSFFMEEYTIKGNTILGIGMAAADCSTGQVFVYDVQGKPNDETFVWEEMIRFWHGFHDGCNQVRVDYQMQKQKSILSIDDIQQKKRNEIIHSLGIDSSLIQIRFSFPQEFSSSSYQNEVFRRVYQEEIGGLVDPIIALGLESQPLSVIALVSLFDYIYKDNASLLTRLQRPTLRYSDRVMVLGNDAVYQLSVFPSCSEEKSSHRKKDHVQCLFDVVHHTSTRMGERLLRERLASPFTSVSDIESSYRKVETLRNKVSDSMFLYQQIEFHLKELADIEKLTRFLFLQTMKPMDVYKLMMSHREIKDVLDKISLYPELASISSSFDQLPSQCTSFLQELQSLKRDVICSMTSLENVENNPFEPNIHPDLDHLFMTMESKHTFMQDVATVLSELLVKGKKTKPPKLTIREDEIITTKSRGTTLESIFDELDHIEIPGFGQLTCKDILITSATKTQCRISHPLWKEKTMETQDLQKTIDHAIAKKWNEMLLHLGNTYAHYFEHVHSFLSQLDVVTSFAKTSIEYNYCKPSIVAMADENAYVDVKGIRHPVLERMMKEYAYVPNDVVLGKTGEQTGMLLFGMNCAGKSSLMKSVGLCVIMAQCGMYVPATSFLLYPFQALYTRINGNDNMLKGLSSFAVEMTELKSILERTKDHPTRTLVIGDEICRGTEAESGVAIVESSMLLLAKRNVPFMFATHLHELTQERRVKETKNVKMYHVRVDVTEDGVLQYNRKLMEGPGESDYGLLVATSIMGPGYHDMLELAATIKKERMGLMGESIVSTKKSKYSKDVFIESCQLCQKRLTKDKKSSGFDTHHIVEQADCENGFSTSNPHIEMNKPYNLVVLCKDCHQMIHTNQMEHMLTYQQTSKGKQLTFSSDS